jgi:hypothetical protein
MGSKVSWIEPCHLFRKHWPLQMLKPDDLEKATVTVNVVEGNGTKTVASHLCKVRKI